MPDLLMKSSVDKKTAVQIATAARSRGDIVVFTNGCFDLLHKGHRFLLEAARKEGDYLIVGLNSDESVRQLKGEGRPVRSEKERAKVLLATDAVDLVTLFKEETPMELIRLIKPDVLVKGGDYRPEEIIGADVVKGRGGRLVTIPLLSGFSTTEIIEGRSEGKSST
ncbi:MAG: D-glycero-beta-D-manno-heptose 1-phosphate adenylyltransferase [Candidatus Marinimicrobia bacterium]|nr:D-glycero-beta-D-manno-heptose 1-phosphate adenylyltransferase [Candidatus Neomarinimicrobiota bacterium]|tara:strand:- start:8195 stop:8692 length:498 start_codon:yes stop_codon:yes gene_type:complete